MLRLSATKDQLKQHRYPRLWAAGFATAPEAAELMSCSLRTLRYRQARGGMPSRHRRGRMMIYRRSDIIKMLRTTPVT
jgi:hypothetical protein